MSFEDTMEWVARGFEVAGVLILGVGSLVALARAAQEALRASGTAYRRLRLDLGRVILLGLEILIIADVVRTIAVEPTVENAAVLGLIVLVRTFLSFSLEVELGGMLPWRRAQLEARGEVPPDEGIA